MSASAADRQIWRSSDVESHRGFDYYRDGICKSFMDLIPEPDGGDDWTFSGSIETMPVGAGRLNRVVATSHLVLRTKAEIARSPAECFYLNYKTRGECRIGQGGQEVVIGPGDVGLFDSTRPFALEHRSKRELSVSSFMLPFDLLRDRLPGGLPDRPMLMSAHPALGHLIREAIATLSREAEGLTTRQAGKLYDMVVDLVAMATTVDGRARIDLPNRRASALLLCAKNHIDRHYAEPGLSAQTVADAVGISVRYLHKLFAGSSGTFSEYLLGRRLESVASALRASGKAHLTIATLALNSGFCEPAHFHRVFKARFGHTAGEWRRSLFAER